jgi:hypothetical protein
MRPVRIAFSAAAFVALLSCSAPENRSASLCTGEAGSKCTAPVEPANASTVARVRLLTEQQYFNTIAYMFGEDMRTDARFAPFKRTDGLISAGAASAGVTLGGAELFHRTAATVSAHAVDATHRRFVVPCTPKVDNAADDACARQFLSAVGRGLYRRTLDEHRLNVMVGEADAAADKLKDFYSGLAVALEGMLADPAVLFVAERKEADPNHPGQFRLDGYSLATRLSLFLWNALPDEALLQAAEKGELFTDKGRARAINRMLASPRIEGGVRALFDDMLALEDLDNLSKDAKIYPGFTPPAVGDAREQTLRTIVDHVIKKNGDYRDLFTTRSTFISPALALVYQMPTPPGWRYYEWPEGSPRAGLLTQIAFLAAHAHPARSSATRRGKALRELLLCQKVPEPPANVDFSALENPNAAFHTARERVTAHLANPVCAGCHRITDPMGLALENFDGVGQYRETEKGAVIDVSGTLDGKPFKDVAGLAQAVRNHPSLPTCLVRRTYSYATGGPLAGTDTEVLDYLNKSFAAHGYKIPELLRAIASGSAFYEITKPETAEKTPTSTTGH